MLTVSRFPHPKSISCTYWKLASYWSEILSSAVTNALTKVPRVELPLATSCCGRHKWYKVTTLDDLPSPGSDSGVDYLEGTPISKTPGEQDNALGNNENRNSKSPTKPKVTNIIHAFKRDEYSIQRPLLEKRISTPLVMWLEKKSWLHITETIRTEANQWDEAVVTNMPLLWEISWKRSRMVMKNKIFHAPTKWRVHSLLLLQYEPIVILRVNFRITIYL